MYDLIQISSISTWLMQKRDDAMPSSIKGAGWTWEFADFLNLQDLKSSRKNVIFWVNVN